MILSMECALDLECTVIKNSEYLEVVKRVFEHSSSI